MTNKTSKIHPIDLGATGIENIYDCEMETIRETDVDEANEDTVQKVHFHANTVNIHRRTLFMLAAATVFICLIAIVAMAIAATTMPKMMSHNYFKT